LAFLPAREVDLRHIAGDDGLAAETDARENIFICSGVVFCARRDDANG
jgi:hypothetical protein